MVRGLITKKIIQKEMVQCLQENTKTKIIHNTPQGEEFDFLRPTGKITLKNDEYFHVLLLDIELDH